MSYREVVATQAQELERRMYDAGVRLTIQTLPPRMSHNFPRWSVCLERTGERQVVKYGVTVPDALWAACKAAGLTDGLVPPRGDTEVVE